MSLVDVLAETKAWAEEQTFPHFMDKAPWTGVYPPVNLVAVCGDQLEDATGECTSGEVIDVLRGYLAATPDDVAVRWTVLGCLYVLSRAGQEDEDDDDAEDDDDIYWAAPDRERFRDELAALVRLADTNRLADPRAIRWEISNACVVADFERAEALFQRLDEVDRERLPDNLAVRGQFCFWRSFTGTRHTDGFLWIPVLFPSGSKYALDLARWALDLEQETVASNPAGPYLRDASHYFQKSLEAGYDLPSVHRAVLARCLLIDGNYARAAATYQDLLSRGLVLDGRNAQHNDELSARLYLTTADVHGRLHDPTAARALLQQCLQKHPVHAEAYRRLAELYADESRYEDAYKVLDRWAEHQPEVRTDIWARTLLALGRVEKPSESRRVLEEYFTNHPERLASVKETVESHWELFEALGEEASKEWLYGCFLLWWATPGYESVHYAKVIHHFTVAVEIELRDKVFRPFIEEVRKGKGVTESVSKGKSQRAKRWHKWIERRDFSGTLGDMLHELDPSRECGLLPWQKLQAWLGRERRQLKDRFLLLSTDRLTNLRNPAVHRTEPLSREEALEACRLSQTFLTALLSTDAARPTR